MLGFVYDLTAMKLMSNTQINQVSLPGLTVLVNTRSERTWGYMGIEETKLTLNGYLQSESITFRRH